MAENDVRKRSRHSEYHKRWKADSLGDDFVQTYAHISREDHARVQELAQVDRQRIPKVIGKLVRLGLDILDLKQPDVTFRIPSSPPNTDIGELTSAVLRSRFPGDTGAARFRMLAVINLIHLETLNGNTPTGNSIAVAAETHPSQMNVLTRLLEQRGIISRSPLPQARTSGKPAYALRIREDALEALNQVHILVTGKPIHEGPPADTD